MKRILVFLVILILVSLTIIYLLIPSTPKFSSQILIRANAGTVTRIITDTSKWMNWFPPDRAIEAEDHGVNTFEFGGSEYTIEIALMNYAQVAISSGNTRATSLLTVVGLDKDSTLVEWKGETLKGINPVKRVQAFFIAKKLEKDVSKIVSALKKFLENQEAVYGINITQTRVVDTLLISKKFTTKGFPTTDDIYSAINELKDYVAANGARETNPPMLNVQNSPEGFRTMVALPISRNIPEKNDFVIKRMVPGKILVAEVKGGNSRANEALQQLNQYISDKQLSSPAIPFQSLTTDRTQEPDSNKWITKVYYPIY